MAYMSIRQPVVSARNIRLNTGQPYKKDFDVFLSFVRGELL